MKFITLSEKEIPTTYLLIQEPHVLISVTNPSTDISLPSSPHCKGILKLKFHDVEDIDDSKYTYFDCDMAKSIIDFVNEYADKIVSVVVHCGAGVSRSVAIASALSKIINNVDDEVFTKGAPNMLVYTTLLTEYFSEPKFKSKWHKIYYNRDNNLKKLLNPVVYRILQFRTNKREKDSTNEQ